jgi:hypothetical protein
VICRLDGDKTERLPHRLRALLICNISTAVQLSNNITYPIYRKLYWLLMVEAYIKFSMTALSEPVTMTLSCRGRSGSVLQEQQDNEAVQV